MKRLLTGDCRDVNIWDLVDPFHFVEIDFEAEVVNALSCLLPDYYVGVFSGSFVLEGERHVSDLALIHKKITHWFVVEVELVGHSFERHVLPQVRCFRYGEPEASCVTSLSRAFPELNRKLAERIINIVPRFVAVIGNFPEPDWSKQLLALDVQHLTLHVYSGIGGKKAYELEGVLLARRDHLGFAKYSQTDMCLRMKNTCGLKSGSVMIVDQFGTNSEWIVTESKDGVWISKKLGAPLFQHDTYVQVSRSIDGVIYLKPTSERE